MSETVRDLPVQEGYAAWAPLYDDDGNPLIAIEEPAVRPWFRSVGGQPALDVGCGTGRHTRGLLEAGACWVAALDLTPEMIAVARRKLAGQPVQWVRHALPGPLPFGDATFAVAVLGLVLEHIAEPTRVLAEVGRVLKPGGRCIASNLHPERTAEGQRARFIDPVTGERQPIRSHHHTTTQLLSAGQDAGFVLEAEQTLVVPETLALTHPRAARYVGMALGWAVCWVKPA